jgi:hypothetical protein
MSDKISAAIIGATGLAGTGHLAGYEAVPGIESARTGQPVRPQQAF